MCVQQLAITNNQNLLERKERLYMQTHGKLFQRNLARLPGGSPIDGVSKCALDKQTVSPIAFASVS